MKKENAAEKIRGDFVVEVNFVKEKDTKNTVRFKEVPAEGKPPIVGTLYLQKWFVGDKQNVKIEITIS